MSIQHLASALRLCTLATGLIAIHASAQPSMPEGKHLHAPDISTIPGAVTMMAADFDLEGTNFEFPYEKWLQVNAEGGSEASVTFVPKIPGGSYTFALDAVREAKGQATFSLKVGDEELEAKEVPLLGPNPKGRLMAKLIWTEIPFALGSKITITAHAAKEGDEVIAPARWTRLIMIPHKHRAMFLKAPAIAPPSGGPRAMKPPAQDAEESEKKD